MTTTDHGAIAAKVQAQLEGTDFASSGVRKLAGGSVNYVYHAPLRKALADGTTEVLVKHGETHMARKPDFPLPMLRTEVEYQCLKSQACAKGSRHTGTSDGAQVIVRTPRVFHFDQDNGNQIMEYFTRSTDLKSYSLKYYTAPTPLSLQPQCFRLGEALGRWLRTFHQSIMQDQDVVEVAKQNEFASHVKHMVNYTWLFDRLKSYPKILEGAKDAFEGVEQNAAKEEKLQVNHGDFWIGNILIPDENIQEGKETPLVVIDWESCQLGPPSVDIGEMLAEMYALWRYKCITAGLWMMEGFARGYAENTQDSVFRTAIQMGTHLLCVTTDDASWGTTEQTVHVVQVAQDIIVNAWKKDRTWFENSELKCLFDAC